MSPRPRSRTEGPLVVPESVTPDRDADSPPPPPAGRRILLLACAPLETPLREEGLEVVVHTDLETILHPETDLDARAIVLHRDPLRGHDLGKLIPRIRDAWPLVDVLVWAPEAPGSVVRDGLRAGAADILLSVSPERAARGVVKVLAAQTLLPRATRPRDRSTHGVDFEGMTSRSPIMWNLFDTAAQVASTEATVLILGETGTGKELLARAIHARSSRRGHFVAVNCGAIPESLIDSELFGHVEGAFTGAHGKKEGLFRYADGGTLMLDEMGTIAQAAQHRLLRVLQEGTIRPVGGHEEVAVDVRVIAATSSDLIVDVEEGRFREDLYYRLDVIRLEIPPLRERPEDIVFLFGRFARRTAEQYSLHRPELAPGVVDRLVEYEWPGNVRQLENFTEQLLLTHPDRTIGVAEIEELLPAERGDADEEGGDGSAPRSRRLASLESPAIDTSRPLREVLDERLASLERALLEAYLEESRGRVGAAAEQAGISRRTLLRKMQQYGIDKMEYRRRDR